METFSLFSLLYNNKRKNNILQNTVITIDEYDYSNLFKKSKIKRFNSYIIPIRDILDGVEFHNIVFLNCNFKSFFFQNNKFINCSFQYCSFNFTIFLECDFQNTTFKECFFEHCNFHDTKFNKNTLAISTSFINTTIVYIYYNSNEYKYLNIDADCIIDNSIIQSVDYESLKEKLLCFFVYNPCYPGEMSRVSMLHMANPPKQYKQNSKNILILILDIKKDNYIEYVDKYFEYYKPHGVVLPGFDTNSIKFQHLDENCVDFSLSTQMIREHCIELYLNKLNFCLLGICRGFQDIMSVLYGDKMTMYNDDFYFLNVLKASIPLNNKIKTEKYFTGNRYVVKLLDECNLNTKEYTLVKYNSKTKDNDINIKDDLIFIISNESHPPLIGIQFHLEGCKETLKLDEEPHYNLLQHFFDEMILLYKNSQ